ncbi:hypothetical protein ACOMHN_010667 [Nucella lapillus]
MTVCVLLMVALKPSVVTSLVTSYEKLRDLVTHGDELLVQALERNVQMHLDKIRNLTRLLTEHTRKGMGRHELRANHPNDFYRLVKHYINSWTSENIDRELLKEVIKSEDVSFPTSEDLTDAQRALVRLQYVYRLNASDMFHGNYSGHMGSPLDLEDAYRIGQHAVSTGFLAQGIDWLHVSADKLRTALVDSGGSDDGGHTHVHSAADSDRLSRFYVKTLALLGRAYFYDNKTEMARRLYDQCNASNGDTTHAVTNLANVDALRVELEAENADEIRKDYTMNVWGADEDDVSMSLLCAREKEQRVDTLRPYHVCRYKADAFIPYYRFREEILSTSPYASVFYDIIHESEIDRLKKLSKRTLSRGQTLNKDGKPHISQTRTGDLTWLYDREDPVVARISHRVKAFTRLDVFKSSGKQFSSEPFQLSDVEKGGATVFPKLGVSVSPQKVEWSCWEPDVTIHNENSLHAGCPVVIGNKWIANKWIWIYGNTFRRPCGASPQSRQLDLEKMVSLDALKT